MSKLTLNRMGGGEFYVTVANDVLYITGVRNGNGCPVRLPDAPFILTEESTRELAEALDPLSREDREDLNRENRRLEADNLRLVKVNQQLESAVQRLEAKLNVQQSTTSQHGELLEALRQRGINGDTEAAALYLSHRTPF